MSAVIGLIIGCVGTDIVQGQPRFTYGVPLDPASPWPKFRGNLAE